MIISKPVQGKFSRAISMQDLWIGSLFPVGHSLGPKSEIYLPLRTVEIVEYLASSIQLYLVFCPEVRIKVDVGVVELVIKRVLNLLSVIICCEAKLNLKLNSHANKLF